jgi:hypothetical protein
MTRSHEQPVRRQTPHGGKQIANLHHHQHSSEGVEQSKRHRHMLCHGNCTRLAISTLRTRHPLTVCSSSLGTT